MISECKEKIGIISITQASPVTETESLIAFGTGIVTFVKQKINSELIIFKYKFFFHYNEFVGMNISLVLGFLDLQYFKTKLNKNKLTEEMGGDKDFAYYSL